MVLPLGFLIFLSTKLQLCLDVAFIVVTLVWQHVKNLEKNG